MADYAEGGGNEISIASIAPSAYNLDAFGRLRVSNTVTLFDSVHTYGLNGFFWDEIEETGGTVTYTSNANKAVLSCTATTNSRAVHSTHNYLRYQPAKSQYIKATGVLGSGTLRVVRRSSVGGTSTDTAVSQSSFNRDLIDGTGCSGFDIDTTQANIFTIDFQYLGVGIVRFGVVGSDGSLISAHSIENANNKTSLYMLTAMLPFRTEIYNDGTNTYKRIGYFDDDDGLFWEVQTTAGAGSMDFFCCSIESEDGQNTSEERGLPFAFSTGDEKFDYNGTLKPVVSIRPKATFKSKTNRGIIIPEFLSVITEAQAIRIAIVLNGTLDTGTSWVSVDDDSIVEGKRHNDASASISGGKILREYRIDQSQGLDLGAAFLSQLGLSLDALGTTPDVLSICIEALENNNDAHVAINWKELY